MVQFIHGFISSILPSPSLYICVRGVFLFDSSLVSSSKSIPRFALLWCKEIEERERGLRGECVCVCLTFLFSFFLCLCSHLRLPRRRRHRTAERTAIFHTHDPLITAVCVEIIELNIFFCKSYKKFAIFITNNCSTRKRKPER